MKIKTSELTGVALDWAVAKCEGYEQCNHPHLAQVWMERRNARGVTDYCHISSLRYSTEWAQGGPIIEREKIDLYLSTGHFAAAQWINIPGGGQLISKATDAPTPLIAAMCCYVASKLGDAIDIPDSLA